MTIAVAPERIFWSGKAVPGNEGRRLRFQHYGVDRIDVRTARVAALDFAAAAGSAQNVINLPLPFNLNSKKSQIV